MISRQVAISFKEGLDGAHMLIYLDTPTPKALPDSFSIFKSSFF